MGERLRGEEPLSLFYRIPAGRGVDKPSGYLIREILGRDGLVRCAIIEPPVGEVGYIQPVFDYGHRARSNVLQAHFETADHGDMTYQYGRLDDRQIMEMYGYAIHKLVVWGLLDTIRWVKKHFRRY